MKMDAISRKTTKKMSHFFDGTQSVAFLFPKVNNP